MKIYCNQAEHRLKLYNFKNFRDDKIFEYYMHKNVLLKGLINDRKIIDANLALDTF